MNKIELYVTGVLGIVLVLVFVVATSLFILSLSGCGTFDTDYVTSQGVKVHVDETMPDEFIAQVQQPQVEEQIELSVHIYGGFFNMEPSARYVLKKTRVYFRAGPIETDRFGYVYGLAWIDDKYILNGVFWDSEETYKTLRHEIGHIILGPGCGMNHQLHHRIMKYVEDVYWEAQNNG